MKRITLFLSVMLFSFAIFAQKNEVKIKLKADENSFEVINKGMQSLTVKSTLSALYFSDAKTKGGDFTLLQANGLIKIFDMGSPNIPVVSKLIEVPQDAKVKINIVSYDEQIFNLADYGIMNKIVPAQRSISKSEDPIDVPFAYDEKIYNKDGFVNTTVATYEESGMLRATRLGRLEISPIQYNPAKNQIRVLNNLVVEVEFVGANIPKTQALKTKYASSYYDKMFGGQILNYQKADSKELVQATTHMVIVADRMFEAQLQEFIEWKELKGFDVTVGYTDDIGANTTDIKAYLQAIYEGSDPMEFVLFVGDVQQVPTFTSSQETPHVTDLRYCEYTGDNLPEVYYGRFSAQTTAQLQPQIDKTLMYEKYEMSDPSYLSEVFLVAGDDEAWEDIYGNGAIWYADNYYMNADNGVNAHTYLQDFDNNAVSDIIVQDMNAGLAFANYTAHCSSSGWGTPNFVTSDVNSLTNSEKYGIWIGNCCQSVMFGLDECFGEAALRKVDGGAIGDIGGSESTYWDEDYWWGVGLGTPVEEPAYENFDRGVYDGMMHTLANESDISTWMTAQGQYNVCGNLAVESSSSGLKQYYWEIYHLMGDPTLMNFIGVPDAITYTLNPAVLFVGANSTEISTVPYGYIAVHQGGNRICVASADGNGDATLNFSSTIVSGDVTLVITAQNKQPLIETIVPFAIDEPFIALNSYATSADPDFGTAITLDVTLENLALSGSGNDATNVSAVLSITDDYVTITDASGDFGDMAAAATSTQSGTYAITIANDVPDGYVFNFDLAITADEGSWNSTLHLTANAPEFKITGMTITNDDDNNGRLDPGETADLIFTTSNVGNANASDILASLIDDSSDLTIATDEQFVTINTDGTTDVIFSVSASSSTVEGTLVNLTMSLEKNVVYTAEFEQDLTIGQEPMVIIGEGTETSGNYPFYTWYKNNKTQMLYLGSEIGAGDMLIQEIAFDFTNTDGTITYLTDLQINFKETSLTQFGSSYEDMTGATTVLSSASYTMPQTNGWYSFDIDNFDFDANQNLIIEIIWGDNGDYGDYGDEYKLNCTSTDFTSVAYGYADSETPPFYDGNSSVRPNITMYFGIAGQTAINKIESNINIYPNPSNGVFNINLANTDNIIEIYNIKGQLILSQETNDSNTTIDLSSQSKGVYILKLQFDEQTITEKIIVE